MIHAIEFEVFNNLIFNVKGYGIYLDDTYNVSIKNNTIIKVSSLTDFTFITNQETSGIIMT